MKWPSFFLLLSGHGFGGRTGPLRGLLSSGIEGGLTKRRFS
jgi:hypothetical protein